MTRATAARALALVPLSLVGLAAAGPVSWQELTQADWLYEIATRFGHVDGHEVHYPTPTAELAALLAESRERDALRHLAEARRELGDWAGAEAALASWADAATDETGKAQAWDEAARWGAAHVRMELAFRAAERALPGLGPEARRALADERVRWADAHPEAADPMAMRRSRAEIFPAESSAVEDWISALEKAGKLDEADQALAAAQGLPAERKLLHRAQLLARHGSHRRAFDALDAALRSDQGVSWTPDLRKAYAEHTDRGANAEPESWRAALERRFDPEALLRLATYFQGKERGGAAADLLRQVERRYETGFDRGSWLLLSRLHEIVDSIPEAFRARLAAAQAGTPQQQGDDLAPLGHLALRAGGRPLAWGTYNDEPYRWVARADRTPGFWTGGVSFLLTGQDWRDALSRLESESLADRTFATARALAAELERRSARHAALPELRAAIMAQHVRRGEGKEALALLPSLEEAPPEVADAARETALLAARQVEMPLPEEQRLFRLRLKAAAPDASRPSVQPTRSEDPDPASRYKRILDDALARLEQRDPTHRAALDLVLGELDRLPDAEGLWAALADRLESWNLDDEMGPRYERALARFQEATWWARAARWYARRSRHRDLQRLAEEIAGRFRGSEILARGSDPGVRLEIPEQPRIGARVRLVAWADWVRLKALERFPHDPALVRDAVGRLLRHSEWEKDLAERGAARIAKDRVQKVVVDDALMDRRFWAVFFVETPIREAYLRLATKDGSLEARLAALESQSEKTPVQDLVLFEGWSRLSRFERAAAPADRLAAAYPGDAELAGRVLSLHRSLAGLDPSHAAPAAALVARTAPAVLDPSPLWTALGELHEERGHPEAALPVWRQIVDREPRNPERISELATLLWDYGHMPEALAVVEAGRKRLDRPRFFAFETGVLREEVKDIHGAVREYLAALWPESGDCCSYWERDQRSLRRLSQLLGRERVLELVLKRIQDLKPGVREDEEALASLFAIAPITMPEPGLDWDVDDWIDAMDMPNDPVGRERREKAMAAGRPKQHEGVDRLTDALLAKTRGMIPKASRTDFLDAATAWSGPLLDARSERDQAVGFRAAVLLRGAELAPTEEDRIAKEVERGRFLADNGRRDEADALWSSLASRIGRLPEGAPRMHAEAERAAYVERTRGVEDAARVWRELTDRYPWSLGLLEDRLAFLARVGRGAEGRAALAAAAARAASGHREDLLTRLTRESIDAGDLKQARIAVEGLLQQEPMQPASRLSTVHLLARLSWKEDPGFDPLPLAKAEEEKLGKNPELRADLYRQLAQAAGLEKAWPSAVTLWIEALNRRLERAWLAEACRAADKAGKRATLVAFFEKQQARSPRDVRWAVAVREIRRHADNLAGAIEMARTAVAVRPEQESLWREAVDLMLRADRVRDAADYLDGWSRPRAADEDAARWRGELYARAGDGAKALEVERAALSALAREARDRDEKDRELRQRTARAASRLSSYGYPRLAWKILGDSAARVASSEYSSREQAELALLTGNFVRLLRQRLQDDAFRSAAADVLRQSGRPEHKEEVQSFLLGQLFPAPGAAGSEAALLKLWPFVESAGLESRMRFALARQAVAAAPGPWQVGASVPFLETVGGERVTTRTDLQGRTFPAFAPPSLDALWARELVRLDRGEELRVFLEPRWQELMRQVRSPLPIPKGADRALWASWLDEASALEAWARGAASSPTTKPDLAEVFSERRLWDRFWALAARGWSVSPLVGMLPVESRTAWFRFWQQPVTTAAGESPVARARRESVERVSLAVGRLVVGAEGAAADPLVAKLRGPRSVGDVLGTDTRWTWPEFTPRRKPSGELREQGDDRVVGQGVDALRLPGALWGDRPGEAWYVLESLARFRDRDPEAPLVPLEAPERARQSERASLAIRMAESLGDTALALELEEAYPGRAQDLAWLTMRLRLLAGAGQKPKAEAALRAHVRALQASLTEAQYRGLSVLAQELSLATPLDLMDPAAPVSPGLLAYLYDRRGASVAARFTTPDVTGFRAALGTRWSGRGRALGADQVRYALDELWAHGAMDLPRPGLAKLGGLWPHAADWLEKQRPADRAEALAALRALPDTAPFQALAARGPRDDVAHLLAIRIHLLRQEDDRALAIVDEMIAGLQGEAPLRLEPPAEARPTGQSDADADEGAEEGDEAEAEAAPEEAPESDAFVTRLEAWLRPFQDASRAETVEERFRIALETRRESGPVPVAAWRLALELTRDPADRSALLREVEHAWIRGDWSPHDLGPLVEVLARQAPEEAPRWLARWPQAFDHAATERRAKVLVALGDKPAAARLVVEARTRQLWTAEEEVRAFDTWRRLVDAAPPQSPPTWAAALPFWKRKADDVAGPLGVRLRQHTYDLLSARAALRTASPAEEDPLRAAALVLDDPAMASIGDSASDAALLRLRIARGLMKASPRAASTALAGEDPGPLARDLVRRRMRRADVDAALADVARIAARTGDGPRPQAVVSILADRRSSEVKALRAELRELEGPQQPARSFRVVDGAPAPYRPRDLTWSVLETALAAEAKR